MKDFLNIRTDDQPLYIPAADVTAIQTYEERHELVIYGEDGPLMKMDYKSWGVNPKEVPEKFQASNNPLIAFTHRGRNPESEESTTYIAPGALAFVSTTQTREDGTFAAAIGVKGFFGWLESDRVKPEELQALLDGAKAAGKNFIKYEPDIAYSSNWHSDPAALYIDPSTVRKVYDNGPDDSIHIYCEKGAEIRVSTQRRDRHWMSDEECDSRKTNFVNSLGRASSRLVEIVNARHAAYVRPEEFAYIHFDDIEEDPTLRYPEHRYEMALQKQHAYNTTPVEERGKHGRLEPLHAYFRSAAQRAEAFAALTRGNTQPVPVQSLEEAPTP